MSYDFHNVVHIKRAKKQHLCCETRAVINLGEPYVRLSGVHEGDFYSECMHPEIYPIYARRNSDAWKRGDEGIAFGDLHEDIEAALSVKDVEAIQDAEIFCRLWNGRPTPHYLQGQLDKVKSEGGQRQ